jgi:molybdopterin converting factor subunit 1
MRVNVLYFGIVREKLGCGGEAIELEAGAAVADVLRMLEGRHGSLKTGVDSLRIAVNREYVDSDHLLSENDEIAVIPPVSGGKRVRDH